MSTQKKHWKNCIITDCEPVVKIGHERYDHVKSGEALTRARRKKFIGRTISPPTTSPS
jgi:hypothetical protein